MKPFIQAAIESGEILHEDIQDIIKNVKRTPTRRDEEGQIVHERGTYTTVNGNEYLLYRNTITRQEKTVDTCIDELDVTEDVSRETITGENDGNIID